MEKWIFGLNRMRKTPMCDKSERNENVIINKNIEKNSRRDSNIDLLRIISIFMIVFFHFAYKGEWWLETSIGSTSRCLLKIFLIFGELGVDLFMLMTGYFLIHGERKWKKVCKLILQSVFYTILINFFLWTKGAYTLDSFNKLCQNLFPEAFNTYWYVSTYLVIYMISPYLNEFIYSAGKKKHQECIILSLIIWSVLPTLFQLQTQSTEPEEFLGYNRFVWYIVMYCVGAYIKLYQSEISEKGMIGKYIVIASTIFLTMVAVIVFTEQHPQFFSITVEWRWWYWEPNTILMFLLSVTLFNIFRLLSVPYNKFINVIASTSMGVYIIYDGNLQFILWPKIKSIFVSGPFPIRILKGTILVFIVAVVIDLGRQMLVRYCHKLLDKQSL